MPKKIKRVAKKDSVGKSVRDSSIAGIWYVLAALLILVALFFFYKGLTGSVVITGNALTDTLSSNWNSYAQPALEYLLGQKVNPDSAYKFSDFFSMALLILIIVFSIVFVTVKSIPFFNDPEHSWTVWVVSIAVSLLAVRFLTAEWLITILLPYSTIGIAISAGFPFILYYFLVEKFKSDTLKRIFWFFFGIIFLYLWYDRTQTANAIALTVGPYYEIYLWTAIAAIIMALYGQKAAEKVRKKIKREGDVKSSERTAAHTRLRKLHEEQANWEAMKNQSEVGSSEYQKADREWRRVTAEIARLRGLIAS